MLMLNDKAMGSPTFPLRQLLEGYVGADLTVVDTHAVGTFSTGTLSTAAFSAGALPEQGMSAQFCHVDDLSYLCLEGALDRRVSLRMRANRYSVLITLDGETGVIRSGREVLLAPGQAIMLLPGERADLLMEGAGRRYFVSFGQDALSNGLVELDMLSNISLQSTQGSAVEINQRSDIGQYIAELIARSDNSSSARISICYNSIILFLIIEAFYTPAVKMELNSASGHYIDTIKRYISENITGDLCVEKLASCAGISKRQVYNLFSRLFGMTPGEYIRKVRVFAVHHEISNSSSRENITDIVMKYGFSNPGRFSQQYKAYFGELPSQTLRKRLRGNVLQY